MRDIVLLAPGTEGATKLWATVRSNAAWPTKHIEPGFQNIDDRLGRQSLQLFVVREARPSVDTNQMLLAAKIKEI